MKNFDGKEVVTMASKMGQIKRTALKDFEVMKKSLSKKYLNIFERFDIKKQQKIDEIILIIDGKK